VASQTPHLHRERTRVIDAFIALANAIITTRRLTRRLTREAWTRYRWNTRPTRQP
jgi:hypothetical protein